MYPHTQSPPTHVCGSKSLLTMYPSLASRNTSDICTFPGICPDFISPAVRLNQDEALGLMTGRARCADLTLQMSIVWQFHRPNPGTRCTQLTDVRRRNSKFAINLQGGSGKSLGTHFSLYSQSKFLLSRFVLLVKFTTERFLYTDKTRYN